MCSIWMTFKFYFFFTTWNTENSYIAAPAWSCIKFSIRRQISSAYSSFICILGSYLFIRQKLFQVFLVIVFLLLPIESKSFSSLFLDSISSYRNWVLCNLKSRQSQICTPFCVELLHLLLFSDRNWFWKDRHALMLVYIFQDALSKSGCSFNHRFPKEMDRFS